MTVQVLYPVSEAPCTVIVQARHAAVYAQPAPQNLTCSICSAKRSSRGAGDFPFPLLASVWCTAGSMARPSSCCLSAPAPAYAGKKTVRHCLRRPACSVCGSKWATSSCASTCKRMVRYGSASFSPGLYCCNPQADASAQALKRQMAWCLAVNTGPSVARPAPQAR